MLTTLLPLLNLANAARAALAIIALWGLATGYIAWQRYDAAREATAAMVSKLKTETAEEISRRNAIIDAARRNAERMADTISANSTKNQETVRKIDDYAPQSVSLAAVPLGVGGAYPPPPRSAADFALDARSVRFLNDIGRSPSRRAGSSKPDAKAAGAVRRPAAAPKPRNQP
jgi:crotonobetainyl-CoA:carnitine CoA-transferase CaiB-like acyl-CoA transferase